MARVSNLRAFVVAVFHLEIVASEILRQVWLAEVSTLWDGVTLCMEYGDTVGVAIVENTILFETSCLWILVVQGLFEIEICHFATIFVYCVLDNGHAV